MSAGIELEPEGARLPAAPGGPGHAVGETLIERRSGWRFLDLGELWRYRELLYFLSWRDIKLRYKQTVLGATWALLQPLATMAVFTLFLRPAGGAGEGVKDYALFVYAGLLPWVFFANAVTSAAQSIVGNQNLVTKVYFPRLLIPAGSVLAHLPDFLIGCGLLLAFMAFSGMAPGFRILLVVPVLLAALVSAAGAGILLAALNVAYRDFRYVVPFLVQLGLFTTPAIYWSPEALARSQWRWLLPLNPMQGVVAAFREAVFDRPPDGYSLAVSAGVGLLLLLGGCLYFRRVERGFADII